MLCPPPGLRATAATICLILLIIILSPPVTLIPSDTVSRLGALLIHCPDKDLAVIACCVQLSQQRVPHRSVDALMVTSLQLVDQPAAAGVKHLRRTQSMKLATSQPRIAYI